MIGEWFRSGGGRVVGNWPVRGELEAPYGGRLTDQQSTHVKPVPSETRGHRRVRTHPARIALEIRHGTIPSVTRPLNRHHSLEELEDERWPAPSGDATRLVATPHALRRKPIGEPTVEDMGLLIGQNEGLPHLLPPASEALRLDPMAEGQWTRVICRPRY